MNNTRRQELIKIVNELSNDDLMFIMNACSDRINVYVGSYKNHSIGFEGIDCSFNGCGIQINTPDLGLKNTYNLEKHINGIDKESEDKILDEDEDNEDIYDVIIAENNVCKYYGSCWEEAKKHYFGLLSAGIEMSGGGIMCYENGNTDDWTILTPN